MDAGSTFCIFPFFFFFPPPFVPAAVAAADTLVVDLLVMVSCLLGCLGAMEEDGGGNACCCCSDGGVGLGFVTCTNKNNETQTPPNTYCTHTHAHTPSHLPVIYCLNAKNWLAASAAYIVLPFPKIAW